MADLEANKPEAQQLNDPNAANQQNTEMKEGNEAQNVNTGRWEKMKAQALKFAKGKHPSYSISLTLAEIPFLMYVGLLIEAVLTVILAVEQYSIEGKARIIPDSFCSKYKYFVPFAVVEVENNDNIKLCNFSQINILLSFAGCVVILICCILTFLGIFLVRRWIENEAKASNKSEKSGKVQYSDMYQYTYFRLIKYLFFISSNLVLVSWVLNIRSHFLGNEFCKNSFVVNGQEILPSASYKPACSELLRFKNVLALALPVVIVGLILSQSIKQKEKYWEFQIACASASVVKEEVLHQDKSKNLGINAMGHAKLESMMVSSVSPTQLRTEDTNNMNHGIVRK